MPRQGLTRSELVGKTRKAVEESNLTQQQVADRLGVTQPAVAQAVSGSTKMDSLRCRIIEELTGEVVEKGFLVEA